MHFGATLRLLRVDAGFTLRELADRIGVSNAYLSRVENGHDAPPTPDRLVALARAFGLGPTSLVELADRVTPIAADYFDDVPAARDLMLDVVRRKLGPMQIARVRAFIEREFPDRQGDHLAREAAALFDPARVVVGLSGTELEDVVDVAATRLAAEDRRLSVRALSHAVLERERSCPTALGSGLAIPHAVLPGVKPAAVVVTLRRPLAIDTPDGSPLRMVIVHIHPGAGGHTRILAQLARLAGKERIEEVAALRSPQAIVRSLIAALG